MSSADKFLFETEPERYEFQSPSLHQFALARRDFFKILGSGIAVFAVSKNALGSQETAPGPRMQPPQLPKEITSWLHIGNDGIVTAFSGKVEVGQNARTSLSQSVADEFRVPFSSVRMVLGDTELTPFDMGTFGSRTTPTMVPQLRRVAEAARDLLVEVAAKHWNVAPAMLRAGNAKVTDPATGKSLTYAELAQGKKPSAASSRRRSRYSAFRMDSRRSASTQSGRPRLRHRQTPIHHRYLSGESPLRQGSPPALF